MNSNLIKPYSALAFDMHIKILIEVIMGYTITATCVLIYSFATYGLFVGFITLFAFAIFSAMKSLL